MKVTETKLLGSFIIEPQVFRDKRGYFIESFNQKSFNQHTGLDITFVQDNESLSSKGVLRGLHYQKGKFAQAKLIRVIKGKILDVVVDIRPGSKTFGEHVSVELSEDNKAQFYIPRGFAHGFLVLEDNTIVSYKCDNYYNKSEEAGIIYNDKYLDIDWLLPEQDLILSTKDKELPNFDNVKSKW
jgi:dTDP-4-dehydrorhamnose 3,5-epimerase